MTLRTDVINAIKDPVCQRINLRVGGAIIKGSDYDTIAQCIAGNHIQIVKVHTMGEGESVRYNSTYNCLILRFPIIASALIHEATHAINDWYKERSITELDNESSAFIAMGMYTLIKNPGNAALNINRAKDYIKDHASVCRALDNECTTQRVNTSVSIAKQALDEGNLPIQQVTDAMKVVRDCLKILPQHCEYASTGMAVLIAAELVAHNHINAHYLNKLRALLMASPTYKRKFGSKNNLTLSLVNGILHTPIPQSFLNAVHGVIVT